MSNHDEVFDMAIAPDPSLRGGEAPPDRLVPDLEIGECPLCHCPESEVFDQRSLHGYFLTNRICQGCGLVYLSPRLSGKNLEDFYKEEYRRLYHGIAEPTPQDLEVQESRANFLGDFLVENGVSRVGRHLDIGCSTGTLLRVFAQKFCSRPTGVELDNHHRAYAQKQGLEVLPAMEALPENGPKYDLVSLIHVLEHLPDPVATLEALRTTRLNPDGWLLLEVPNLYAHDSFEIAHLVSYSRMALIQTVRRAGFTPVRVITHGHPRSRLIRLYITLLARPHPAPPTSPLIRREVLVRFKRKVGMRFRWLMERLFPAWAWLPVGKAE